MCFLEYGECFEGDAIGFIEDNWFDEWLGKGVKDSQYRRGTTF
jgi:hypothetical protein